MAVSVSPEADSSNLVERNAAQTGVGAAFREGCGREPRRAHGLVHGP